MSSLFNLTPNIIPYNLSLLQDIEVDTINGDQYLPFNGVVANTYYPLIYNSATGILSQTPITQNVNNGSNPRFTTVNTNSIFNDTGGDLDISNPYGIISFGGSIFIAGNISLYNVITNNKVVISAENTIDYSLRLPLIRNTVLNAPLIASLPTVSGYQTLDYNDQAIKTTSNVNFNSVNIASGQTYKINNVALNIPNQAVDTTSNVQFNSIKCNLILAQSTSLNTVKIGGAGGSPGLPLTGYNYVRITTTATTSGGGGFAFMTGNDGYRGNVGADGGFIYFQADANASQGLYFAASGLCRLASAYNVVEFYVGLARRGTVSTTVMDMLIPITSNSKITGLSLQAPTHIFTGIGTNVASIVMPNTGASYTLTLPTALPTEAGAPLISSLTGTLSYNNQAVLTSSDVNFNSVNIPTGQTYKINNVAINLPNQSVNTSSNVSFNSVNASIINNYLVYARWAYGSTPILFTSTNLGNIPITVPDYRYISYSYNAPENSNWINQGGIFGAPWYGFFGNGCKIRVPFNGMYQITTAIDIPVSSQSLMNAFISKNGQNANDLDTNVCLVSGTLNNLVSPYTARTISLSCSVYLTTTDYICIGLYSEITIASTYLGTRNTYHIALIQRM